MVLWGSPTLYRGSLPVFEYPPALQFSNWESGAELCRGILPNYPGSASLTAQEAPVDQEGNRLVRQKVLLVIQLEPGLWFP